MNCKRLGNSAVMVPEIGLGTLAFRGSAQTIHKAVEQGAVLIDTAESYGTEEALGTALREIRHRVFLGTKVSPRNFRYADILAAAERSLQRLKTDYIDLYQLHWPNYEVPVAETMSAMESLVRQGKVRFIGVSNFSVRELKQAQAALSREKIVANQVRYSLIERTIEHGLLPYCQQNNITVIAFSPLGQSLRTIRSRDQKGALARVAQETKKSESQVALNWCISKAGVLAIPKANSVEHVIENCGASGWRLSAQQIAELSRGIGYRSRSALELSLRRMARRVLQKTGRSL